MKSYITDLGGVVLAMLPLVAVVAISPLGPVLSALISL
jgi:hypothetical protein